MAVNRTFLGWERPIIPLVVDHLLAGRDTRPVDLSDTLIVVPTRQAGRRLRERLALNCAEAGTALLSPEIVLPSYFLNPEKLPSNKASPAAVRAVWVHVLRSLNVRRCKGLFPVGVVTQDLTLGA